MQGWQKKVDDRHLRGVAIILLIVDPVGKLALGGTIAAVAGIILYGTAAVLWWRERGD